MQDLTAESDTSTPPLAGARAPDFFIVGHSKCGTTALTRMVSRHPQVHIPVKEPGYFAPELRSRVRRPRSRRRTDSLEGYLSLFASAQPGQRVGEGTPSYLRSPSAAERIAMLRPDARIVAIFREPVAFLRSLHLQLVHNYTETEKDFRRAIELEPQRRAGRRIPRLSQVPAALLYSDAVRYVEQLRRFEEAFGREQMLVLIYDDLRADNEATVREVWRFLGVEDSYAVEIAELEPLRPLRSLYLYQLWRVARTLGRDIPALGTAGRALRRPLPARVEDALGAGWRRLVFTEAGAGDEELARELRRRFEPEVRALGEYLERDLLTLWGYEGL